MDKIYILDLNKTDSFSGISPSPFRLRMLEKAGNEKRKREILGGTYLLDYGLSRLGFRECDRNYILNEKGKPYFDGLPGIFFSISHSGDFAACAFSDEEVGCDIQKPRAVSPLLMKGFHSEAAFIKSWVLKESCIKAMGGSIFSAKSADDPLTHRGYSFFEFETNGFFGAVCTKSKKKFEIIHL